MKMRSLYGFLFLVFGFLNPFRAHAVSSFYPDKDDLVYTENFWAQVDFKGPQVGVTRFRIIYDAPAEMVFNQLIDTPSLKIHHASYADSKSVSQTDFENMVQAKPKNPNELTELIQNQNPYPNPRKTQGVWNDYWYLRFNLPWPLNDKWVLKKVKVDESLSKQKIYRVEYQMVLGNLTELKGWWEVVPVPSDPNKTEFRGETESNSGVTLPKFIARNTFKSTLKNEFETNSKIFKRKLAQTP